MKKLRRVAESEVIAEFLKNEFYQEEFHRDRHQHEHLVLESDLSNEDDNQQRRTLLFRRRGHMWRELPEDTQWWEVELDAADLNMIRVFPRAHWRKIANGSFALTDIVQQIRSRRFSGRIGDFISKIQSLSYRLRLDNAHSSVILIGLDEVHPITIIEGNHRLTAAMLSSPETVHRRFRVFMGMSDRMSEVCWYNGTVGNIVRYIGHRLQHMWTGHDRDPGRAPEGEPAAATTYARKAVAARKAMSEPK